MLGDYGDVRFISYIYYCVILENQHSQHRLRYLRSLATSWHSNLIPCSVSLSSRYQCARLQRTNDKRLPQTSQAILLRFEQLSMYLITLPTQIPCAAILALQVDSMEATTTLRLHIDCCKSRPCLAVVSALISVQLRAIFKHSDLSRFGQLQDPAHRCTHWAQ